MTSRSDSSRRDFLQTTGAVVAASAFAGMTVPKVHAAENNTINVALIGCGGRGTGAASDCLNVKNGPIKLIAMADVFKNRLDISYKSIQGRFQESVDVPESRRFVGFDAYKQAIDCLKPGDVAIMATPPAFRWVQFTYSTLR